MRNKFPPAEEKRADLYLLIILALNTLNALYVLFLPFELFENPTSSLIATKIWAYGIMYPLLAVIFCMIFDLLIRPIFCTKKQPYQR